MRMPCDMVVGGSCSIHAATRIIFQTFLLDNVDASNICKAACALRMFKDDPEVSGAWKDLMLKLASNPSMQEVVLLVIFQTFLLDAPVRCASWFRHGPVGCQTSTRGEAPAHQGSDFVTGEPARRAGGLPDASPFCSGFRKASWTPWSATGARARRERHFFRTTFARTASPLFCLAAPPPPISCGA